MGSRRGFFAELQHQNQLAARRNDQMARANYQAQVKARRQAEESQKRAQRANDQFARATVAEQKAAEREARRIQDEAMQAEVEWKNSELAQVYEEIDTMLGATLDIDDYVDLEALRAVAGHPPFDRTDLESPIPQPLPIPAPAKPTIVEPEPAPTGLSGLLGGKKRYAELVAQAEAELAQALSTWDAEMAALPELQAAQDQKYQQADRQRLAQLDEARQAHQARCAEQDADAIDANRKLDELISGLNYNVDSAIQEYVGIVLGNSVYPESFPVEHEFEFDAPSQELVLSVKVPSPGEVPSAKQFKYVKASNEVTPTPLPKKDQKDRYANAVGQVALRTMHEIFEADRAGRIQTITLTVGTEGIDPGTGLSRRTPLVAVAADRVSFMTFDLSNIVPLATLQHMNAVVSRNPFELVPIETPKGVRG